MTRTENAARHVEIDEPVTVKDASMLSGLSVRAVYQYAERGKIPGAVTVGSRYFIPAQWARDERARREVPVGYISPSDACRRAGITRQRIFQLIRDGKVEADFRPSGRRRVVWILEQSFEHWHATKPQRKNTTPGGVENIEPENIEEPEGQDAGRTARNCTEGSTGRQ